MQRSESGEELYLGAKILTLDAQRPRASAVAVRHGRILAVGEAAECRSALGERPRELDLAGRTLVPGFIDTHLHPILMIYFDLNADLSGAESLEELQARLRQAADRSAEGEWIVGLQFDEEALAEPRLPTRHELDAACSHRPLLVVKRDGHTVIGNSAALAAAGLDARTPDPPGGAIDREASGFPAGPCREKASQLLMRAAPAPSLERLREVAGASFARLASHGITSAGIVLQTDEEGPGGEPGRLEALAMSLLLDVMPLSLYSIAIGKSAASAAALRSTALEDTAAGHRVGGFKIFADGTFGACTACMQEPFSDQPERSGFMVHDDEEIYRRMREAHLADLQVCVHAIGDEAARRCVALFERLLARHPRADHRHRLEHASILDRETIARIAELGLFVSTQPLFIRSERGWLRKRLGAERAGRAYPLRDLLQAGVVVAGASDAPVESTNVLQAIQCCVTREGFEVQQAIGAPQALRMFTLDAARAQFQESSKGSITPGKRADFAVLDGDPLAVPAEEIASIRVLRTIAAGREIYRHPEASEG